MEWVCCCSGACDLNSAQVDKGGKDVLVLNNLSIFSCREGMKTKDVLLSSFAVVTPLSSYDCAW